MSAPEVELEFRSSLDDAWYSVLVIFRDEKLTVNYCHFPANQDEVFEASKFDSLEELKDFEARFRPASVQLQDSECANAVKGLCVCASHAFSDVDNRFYDAVVEHVMKKRHSISADGEEECLCSFIVLWQHGPLVGVMTEKKVENICLVQCTVDLDRNVASFLEIAKEKLGKKRAKRSGSQNHQSEGWIDSISEVDRQDTDFGGADNYSILLENLEKDLCPSTITEFIHQHTSVVSKSYVFPSLLTELYARGVIVLNTQKDLQVLCEFLNNPDHIIISSRGRPWVVVARNFSRNKMLEPNGTSMLKSQKGNTGISCDLKLAYSGTKEYKKAKELRDLLVEFSLHLVRLHKRLAIEEEKILQSSLAAL